MQTLKDISGILAVIIAIVGYIPYLRNTIKGKTHPHVYSWFLWSLVAAIAFALQVSDKGGVGTLVTLATAAISLLIFFSGLIARGRKDITVIDTIFLIIALLTIPLWLVAKQPLLSIILVSLLDTLGFLPTIRKSWHKPDTETTSTYVNCAIRFSLAVFALQQYTLITLFYPVTLILINSLFSCLLFVRRKQIFLTKTR